MNTKSIMAKAEYLLEQGHGVICIDPKHSDQRIATQIRVAFELSKNQPFYIKSRSELTEEGKDI